MSEETKTSKFVIFLIIFFPTLLIALLMRIIGKYEWVTIVFTIGLTMVFIFAVWVFISIWKNRQPKTDKLYELLPEDAYKMAKNEVLMNEGIIEGEQLVRTVKAVGTDTEKEHYFFWGFRDRIDSAITVGYYRNLKNPIIKGMRIDKKGTRDFINIVETEMQSTMIPTKETAHYVKRTFDPMTGQVMMEEQGINAMPQYIHDKPKEPGKIDVQEG